MSIAKRNALGTRYREILAPFRRPANCIHLLRIVESLRLGFADNDTSKEQGSLRRINRREYMPLTIKIDSSQSSLKSIVSHRSIFNLVQLSKYETQSCISSLSPFCPLSYTPAHPPNSRHRRSRQRSNNRLHSKPPRLHNPKRKSNPPLLRQNPRHAPHLHFVRFSPLLHNLHVLLPRRQKR